MLPKMSCCPIIKTLKLDLVISIKPKKLKIEITIYINIACWNRLLADEFRLEGGNCVDCFALCGRVYLYDWEKGLF